MSLAKIVGNLRGKGFNRHATLLESRAGREYLVSLANPRWESEVRETFGDDVYDMIKARAPGVIYELFEPRDFSVPDLEVVVERVFSAEVLQKYLDDLAKIKKLNGQASKIVYAGARGIIGDDEDLIFRVFKDDTSYFPKAESRATFRTELRFHLIYAKEVLQKSPEEQAEVMDELTDYGLSKNVDSLATMIAFGKEVLRDRKLLSQYFEQWYAVQNVRERVINYGKSGLDEKKSRSSKKGKTVDEILDSDLNSRQGILKNLQDQVQTARNHISGILQLVGGGKVVKRGYPKVSVWQNDAMFPNLKYSQDTLSRLEKLAAKLNNVVDGLDDISDLVAPSKVAKHQALKYYIKEEPKNPLDLSMGSDSGCCIFVPNELKDLRNGITWPYFLNNPAIRFFGVYMRRAKKDKRMGLVVSFETVGPEDKRPVLSSNSLELSRNGVAGGRKTIVDLSGYCELWLGGYTKEFGYAGATMGAQLYNTSFNHSSQKGNKLEQDLVFGPSPMRFYSDIAVSRKGQIVVPKGSSYWICKN